MISYEGPFNKENTRCLLQVEGISFAYGAQSILRDVSFTIGKGETVALIGSSGSGKTTLFHLITGLRAPDAGKITINERDDAARQEEVIYMMQQDLLLPWRTTLGNLMVIGELTAPRGFAAWRRRRTYLAEWREKAMALLIEVGLSGVAGKYPHELSGGMRQRVSLARALLHRRPLLLLDEPFTALDVIIREQIYQLLFDLKKKYQLTILLITHDFNDALQLADRVYVLQGGEISQEHILSSAMRQDPVAIEAMRQTLRASFPPRERL